MVNNLVSYHDGGVGTGLRVSISLKPPDDEEEKIYSAFWAPVSLTNFRWKKGET